jgi:hypothetical protein
VKAWESWTVHLSTVLVAGTGAVYAVMRYLLEPSDPYAVVNHPLQPTVQHLHVLAAPFLVFAAGLIWREHVWKHYKNGAKSGRRSGLWMLPTLLPMVVSGYLIQTTVTEGWRTAWIVVHLATSTLWLVGYAGHAVAAVQRRRAKSRHATDRSTETAPRTSESPGATAGSR